MFISQIIRTVHIASSAFPGHLVTQLLLKVVNHVSVTVTVIQTSIFVTWQLDSAIVLISPWGSIVTSVCRDSWEIQRRLWFVWPLKSSRNRIVVISTVQTFVRNFVYLRFKSPKNKFKFTESNSLTWLHIQTHNARQTVSGLITSKKSLFESRMPFYVAPYCSNRTLRDGRKSDKALLR